MKGGVQVFLLLFLDDSDTNHCLFMNERRKWKLGQDHD